MKERSALQDTKQMPIMEIYYFILHYISIIGICFVSCRAAAFQAGRRLPTQNIGLH